MHNSGQYLRRDSSTLVRFNAQIATIWTRRCRIRRRSNANLAPVNLCVGIMSIQTRQFCTFPIGPFLLLATASTRKSTLYYLLLARFEFNAIQWIIGLQH